MSGVQGFVNGRQQVQPDPRRQAYGNQFKVQVPPARLGSTGPRPITPQTSHGGRPSVKAEPQPDPRFIETSNGHGDLWDTDAEGIDDTTVTSIGNTSSNHQPNMQNGNYSSSGQKIGGSNSFVAKSDQPFAAEYMQQRSRHTLDQLEGEDLTMEDDGGSFVDSESEEVEVLGKEIGEEGSEDGLTEGDGSQEYPDPGGNPEYRPIDYQLLAKSPTMKTVTNAGIGSHSPMTRSSAQRISLMDKARSMGLDRPDRAGPQLSSKQAPAALMQVSQERSSKQRVTLDHPAAPNRQMFQPIQQDGEQSLNTPPSTSSKPTAPQPKLIKRRQENQPLSAQDPPSPSLPIHTKKSHVRADDGSKEMNSEMSASAAHDTMPPPVNRKISPGLDRHSNSPIQQDAPETEAGSIDDQLVDLGRNDDFVHDRRSEDDTGSTASVEAMATRKRPRDLDYSPDHLSAMKFEQLTTEPFTNEPQRIESVLPENIENGTLAEKLDYMLKLGDVDTKHVQRKAILSSLPIEQYRDCGDLIVGNFGKIITKFSDARQQRREIIMRFEAEVAKREARVRSKIGVVEKDFGRLKRRGEDAISGNVDE